MEPVPAPQPEPEPEPEPEPPAEDDAEEELIRETGWGDLKISMIWEFRADIDLRVFEPDGNEIYFANRNSSTGGFLDRDDTTGGSAGNPTIENIYWEHPPTGTYRVNVNYYGGSVRSGGPVKVIVYNNGERSEYNVTMHHVGETVNVVNIDYTPR